MRYIIETKDEQGIIGMQIDKWKKESKLEIIEKANPVIEIQAHLERVARALETLKKAGYNKEVMEIYVSHKSGIGKADIRAVLFHQEQFFKNIGVKI